MSVFMADVGCDDARPDESVRTGLMSFIRCFVIFCDLLLCLNYRVAINSKSFLSLMSDNFGDAGYWLISVGANGLLCFRESLQGFILNSHG